LARRNWKVLLLEKSSWPRSKVCGGCLSPHAVARLHELGLSSVLRGCQPLDSAEWHIAGRSLRLNLPGGAAILRHDFDAKVVAEAVLRGAVFHANCRSSLLPLQSPAYREIQIQIGTMEKTIRAKVVLAADGLAGTSLADEPWAAWRIARPAWIGVSATLPEYHAPLSSSVIHMHLGAGGYAGLVKLPDSSAHLAAALDPAAMRRAGSPAALIESILRSSSLHVGAPLPPIHFQGTPPLTRRRDRLGADRVLVIGDACGYVEPFTGQGMAWAIDSAVGAAELLPTSLNDWPADLPHRWRERYLATIRASQRCCRWLRPMMHHPLPARAAIAVAGAIPAVADLLAACVQGNQASFGYCSTRAARRGLVKGWFG
jgi:flavin-dependent dehydrogenase